jgi:hypothetical protein
MASDGLTGCLRSSDPVSASLEIVISTLGRRAPVASLTTPTIEPVAVPTV